MLEQRDELLQRLIAAGLYSPTGTSPEQRKWIKDRDEWQCQFQEFKNNMFSQCERTVNPKNLPKKGSQHWQLEVHHIYPQHQQRMEPQKYGGENPYNLITLCGGLMGEIGHHDLMQPTMIIAKMAYSSDRWSYDKWISYAHLAAEKGLPTYETQYDFMLKSITRFKTDDYIKRTGIKFPYRGDSNDRASK